MDTQLLYSSIKNYIETLADIKHVAYNEQQAENERIETAYETPAVFIQFDDRERDGLFWRVPFQLKLEVKTLQRIDTTLNIAKTFETHIKSYKGINGERISIEGMKTAHKKGNAPIHIFKCETYQRT